MKTKSTIADLYTSTDIGDPLTVVNENQIDANNLTFTTETQVSKKDPFRSCALYYFFFQWDITFEYHFLKLCAALIITVWCAPRPFTHSPLYLLGASMNFIQYIKQHIFVSPEINIF